MADQQPRYTTQRIHYEIAKAKDYGRREALHEAATLVEKNMLCGLDGVEVLHPRSNPGNKVGLSYAAAIRDLATPAPADWSGWDRSNYPWSAAKHQDAVCIALFGSSWSMGNAHAAISAIDAALSNHDAVNGNLTPPPADLLRAALMPFATDADIYDDQGIDDGEKSFKDNITVGDLRRARAALKSEGSAQ